MLGLVPGGPVLMEVELLDKSKRTITVLHPTVPAKHWPGPTNATAKLWQETYTAIYRTKRGELLRVVDIDTDVLHDSGWVSMAINWDAESNAPLAAMPAGARTAGEGNPQTS